MDPVQLRKTAVEKGFMSEAEAQALNDLEAINLIFRPGFLNCCENKQYIRTRRRDGCCLHQLARINGRIEIKTEKGVGTKFLIRLPLTLAIAQALIVKLKDEELAVPMNLVEETTRFSTKDIQRAAGEEMVNLRGSLLKLIKLNDLLGVGSFRRKRKLPPSHAHTRHGRAEAGAHGRGYHGREEIVVKSLGDYLKKRQAFLRCDDLGRRQCPFDHQRGIAFWRRRHGAAKASVVSSRETPAAPEVIKRKPRVLVVDDSISIRKYVQRFLDRTGYEVEVAPDGMEALATMGR